MHTGLVLGATRACLTQSESFTSVDLQRAKRKADQVSHFHSFYGQIWKETQGFTILSCLWRIWPVWYLSFSKNNWKYITMGEMKEKKCTYRMRCSISVFSPYLQLLTNLKCLTMHMRLDLVLQGMYKTKWNLTFTEMKKRKCHCSVLALCSRNCQKK